MGDALSRCQHVRRDVEPVGEQAAIVNGGAVEEEIVIVNGEAIANGITINVVDHPPGPPRPPRPPRPPSPPESLPWAFGAPGLPESKDSDATRAMVHISETVENAIQNVELARALARSAEQERHRNVGEGLHLSVSDEAFRMATPRNKMAQARGCIMTAWVAIGARVEWAGASSDRLGASASMGLIELLIASTTQLESLSQELFTVVRESPSGTYPVTKAAADMWVIQTVATMKAIAELGKIATLARRQPGCDNRIRRLNDDLLRHMVSPVHTRTLEMYSEALLAQRQRADERSAQEFYIARNAKAREEEELAAASMAKEQAQREVFESKKAERQAVWEQQAVEGHGVDCVVCLSEPSTWCVLPCGHLCMCYNCAHSDQITQCPICRKKNDYVVRIYLN